MVSSFMVSMGLSLLVVDTILENRHMVFKNKVVLHGLREVKCHQGYVSGFCYFVFNRFNLY